MLGKSGKKENEKKNLCAISLLQVVQKGTSQKKKSWREGIYMSSLPVSSSQLGGNGGKYMENHRNIIKLWRLRFLLKFVGVQKVQ